MNMRYCTFFPPDFSGKWERENEEKNMKKKGGKWKSKWGLCVVTCGYGYGRGLIIAGFYLGGFSGVTAISCVSVLPCLVSRMGGWMGG